MIAPAETLLQRAERECIMAALGRSGGHQGRAADEIGMSRRAMMMRVKEYRRAGYLTKPDKHNGPTLPNPTIKNPNDILDHCPEPGELAAWFRGLSLDQMECVWVQAMVLSFGERSTMALALNVVRAKYREKMGTLRVLDRESLSPKRPPLKVPERIGRLAELAAAVH